MGLSLLAAIVTTNMFAMLAQTKKTHDWNDDHFVDGRLEIILGSRVMARTGKAIEI